VMEVVGKVGGILLVHCEAGEMISRLQQEFLSAGKTNAAFHALSRPPEAEITAIRKAIDLCAKTGCPLYIVHVSTGGGADAIREAKRSGLPVFGETCIQYLVLDDSVYDQRLENMKVLPYVISPPIRSAKDREKLWEALADGTFDTVATDHCPFNLHGQKDRGLNDFTRIPNGAGGIEHRLTLLYTLGVVTGKISVNRMIALISSRPAEIFGLDRKGRLETGFDGDIVIWDPDYRGTISVKTHYQQCDSEIYEGVDVIGRPETVIVSGNIVFQNGRFMPLS
jgi:dihydropyrimidinase